jgi:serine/threonine protein kinase
VQAITLPIGTQLGGYVLAGVLGSGASGTVYRARDAEGLPVALKLLHPSVAADPAARRRLAREVRAQRAIRSPFVARVVDVELDGADVFIVTELVDGISLARDITEGGPWAARDLAVLARDIDEALAAVHAAGVVHRDVKPSNVVLRRDGWPVLIDFGIAQSASADRLTGTGLVAGTPGFVSPALLRGGDPTPDSDRWAAAALLLNAATGRQPYGAGSVEVVLARVLEGVPDTDGLPDGLAAAFEAGLDADPARRLTLAELAEAVWSEVPEDVVTAPLPESPEVLDEHLPATRIAPLLPGEDPDGLTDQLWGDPAVVDHRPRSARAPGGVAAPGPVPSYPPVGGGSREERRGRPVRRERSAGASPHDSVSSPFSPYPSPPPSAAGVTFGLWALASALALWIGWGAAAVGSVCLIAGRTVWVAAEALTMRRFRRGQRPTDSARLALGLPWYLVRGAMGALPAVGLAVLVGLGGYLGAVNWLGAKGASAAEAGAAAVALGLVIAWWGPSGEETRHGCRVVEHWIARTRPRRVALAAALASAAALILASWSW